MIPIGLKDEKILYEIPCLHKKLPVVLKYCAKILLCDLSKDVMVITSLYRPKDINDPTRSGIHATLPLRAADIRSSDCTQTEIDYFVNKINKDIVYGLGNDGKEHPTCYYHLNHFHIQVHDGTIIKFE